MARWTRFELATLCVTGRYSNQLNYHRTYIVKKVSYLKVKCVTFKNGGHYKTRTCDIYLVRVALYQLS